MNRNVALLTMVLGLFFLFHSLFFQVVPAVWPDEAIYADIGLNWLKSGRLATGIFGGLLPGAERQAVWLPPVYPLVLGMVYKLVGFSLTSTRLVSLAAGLGILALSIAMTEPRKKGLQAGVALALGLGVDFLFFKGTNVGRPEILAVLFGILGTAAYLLLKHPARFVLAGFFATLAALTHYLNIYVIVAFSVVILVTEVLPKRRIKPLVLLAFGSALPLTVWLVYILPYGDLLPAQFSLVSARKAMEYTNLYYVFRDAEASVKAIYLLYLINSVLVLWAVWVKPEKEKADWLVVVMLIVSWAAAIYGKMFWYQVYPLLWLYLGLVRLAIKQAGDTVSKLALVGLAMLIAGNLYLFWQAKPLIYQSYDSYSRAVVTLVPKRARVLVSTIPDLYFGFKKRDLNWPVYTYPVLPAQKKDYLKLINSMDYVIYNGDYDPFIFKDFLKKNLDKLSDRKISLAEGGYVATIYRLRK